MSGTATPGRRWCQEADGKTWTLRSGDRDFAQVWPRIDDHSHEQIPDDYRWFTFEAGHFGLGDNADAAKSAAEEQLRCEAIGRYIRVRRCQAGLSLHGVAEALGMRHVALGEIERGLREPTPEHLQQLEQVIPAFRVDEAGRVARGESPPPEMATQDLGAAVERRMAERPGVTRRELETVTRLLLGGQDGDG